MTKNNNRDWFKTNKKRYEESVKVPFEGFVGSLISSLQTKNPEIQISPKEAIFRIYRDTRFSKDKTPYKTHISAIISPKGRKGKEYPGFYFHLEPGALMMGGGAYFLEKESLHRLRSHIVENKDRFHALISEKSFKNNFEALQGDQNKRLPSEFKAYQEEIPLIANKQFYYMAELDPKTILADDFLTQTTDILNTGKALNDFLIEGIYGI